MYLDLKTCPMTESILDGYYSGTVIYVIECYGRYFSISIRYFLTNFVLKMIRKKQLCLNLTPYIYVQIVMLLPFS